MNLGLRIFCGFRRIYDYCVCEKSAARPDS